MSCVIWRTGDPETSAATLTAVLGPPLDPGGSGRARGTWDLDGASLELHVTEKAPLAATPGSVHEQLEWEPDGHARLPRTAGSGGDRPMRLDAVGWATVDATRLAAQLGPSRLIPVGNDDALGAAAFRRHVAGSFLVLLEPVTEGRLAAALARRGEGPVALYVEVEPEALASAEARLRELGVQLHPPTGSPFSAATRLVRPKRPWGPFLLLVEHR